MSLFSLPSDLEAHRRACEARYWLKQGFTSASSVSELMARIAKKRGLEAAELLREDMRDQWRVQNGEPT